MSKRRISGREKPPLPPKRRKVEEKDSAATAEPREIKNAGDLKSLLFFNQDSISLLYKNVLQFEAFVKTLRSDANPDSNGRTTLLDYLNSGSSARSETNSGPLEPLFQSWSFATQTNNDQLLRAVPSALATLLSMISDQIEFRKTGLRLCEDLLLEQQFACIEKGLKPSRNKAGVIISCLRLLTQIVGFDGGAMAFKLYRQRETYRQLEAQLTMSAGETEIPDKKKPYHISIREGAVRFLLANLRYQNRSTKAEIVGQGNIVRNLVKGLNNDPPRLVQEFLTVTRIYILEDAELHSSAKRQFLLDVTLTQIANLYRYGSDEETETGSESISMLTHQFLLAACVPNEEGTVEFQESSVEKSISKSAGNRKRASTSEVGLVKGKSLLILLQRLRPHASTLQKTLTLSIFKAQPNLIHDYFVESTFQFDPKLTATWVGFSSFLLSVILLPLPAGIVGESRAHHGETVHAKSVRDSILPPPLHRDVLERCLNLHNQPLITFFAVRLLIAAFQKVQAYLNLLQDPYCDVETRGRSMVDWLCQRCPRGRIVVEAYKLLGKASSLQKEQLSRLLSQYYSLAPRLVADVKFDTSSTIVAEAFESAQLQDPTKNRDELFQMQLSHLLRIALLSPSMRWWNPPGKSLSFSPFISVLRAYIQHQPRNDELLGLLKSILTSHSILQANHFDLALEGLIKSLGSDTNLERSTSTFGFLDTCCFHLSKHDLKYSSMLFELVDTLDLRRDKEVHSFSPLSIAINQQWPFAVDARPDAELVYIAEWIGRYFEAMDDIGESRTILRALRDEMVSKVDNETVQNALKRILPESKRLPILRQPPGSHFAARNAVISKSLSASKTTVHDLAATREQLDVSLAPVPEPSSHPEHTRWRRHDVSDSLEDETVSRLLQNLSSTHTEVRLQSLSALRSFAALLEQSNLPVKTQVYLLLNEVVETARPVVDSGPLPSFATSLAAAILPVLQNPLHIMYPKANDFLLQRPAWLVERLPSYWLRTVLQTEPSQSGMQAREMAWLIERLIEGLTSSADVELYRGNGVLERVLARCPSGLASDSVREAVFRLVYRLTFFTEGSTAFLTRWGGLSWIEGELAWCAKEEMDARKTETERGERATDRVARLALLNRLAETCDHDRLTAWSGGKFKEMVLGLRTRYS